ncbi:MAG: hypothetical protein ABEK59_05420 [Halobacteria archaeon]
MKKSYVRGVAFTVFLFVLLVSLTATAAAYGNEESRRNWDQHRSNGEIILDNTSFYHVFQGEKGIEGWFKDQQIPITGETLVRPPENIRELTLDKNISRFQEPGRYVNRNVGVTARVVEPRITNVEVFDRDGNRLNPTTPLPENQIIMIHADWNFVEAEDVRLNLSKPDGTQVQDDILTTQASPFQMKETEGDFQKPFFSYREQGLGTTTEQTAYWALDLSGIENGTYNLVIEGVKDLNFGKARKSIEITVGQPEHTFLELNENKAAKGKKVLFQVGPSEKGTYHAVAVRERDVEKEGGYQELFGEVGDTATSSKKPEYLYTVIKADSDGKATANIDTSYLKTGNRSVLLYKGQQTSSNAQASVGKQEVDNVTLKVSEGDLTINFETVNYSIGREIQLSGTAVRSVNKVSLYVRDGGEWSLLPVKGNRAVDVGVTEDWKTDTFVPTDESHGGEVLAEPGEYELAVLNSTGLNPPPISLSDQELEKRTHRKTLINSTKSEFFGLFLDTKGLQPGDRLKVQGMAPDSDNVVVGAIGPNGEVGFGNATTDVTNRFSSSVDLSGFGSGVMTAFVLSPGSDGVFGDGKAEFQGRTYPVEDSAELKIYLEKLGDSTMSGGQVFEVLRNNTVDAFGSDDSISDRELELTTSKTSIVDVVPMDLRHRTGTVPVEKGEKFVVRGRTSLDTGSGTITVRPVEGPDADSLLNKTVDSRTGSGWSVGYDAGNLTTGKYVFEVDDGTGVHRREVKVVSPGARTQSDVSETESLHEKVLNYKKTNQELRDKIESMNRKINQLQKKVEELKQERNTGTETETNRSRNGTGDNGTSGSSEGQPGFGFAVALAVLAGAVGWKRLG